MELNPLLLKGSDRLKCTNCGCIFFVQTFIFQKINKFKVGSPNDVIVPIPVHRCSDCGTPIQDELESINEMVTPISQNEGIIKNLIPNSSVIIQ
jgi:DNA-directed RNA polymerase subunit RPC12/RpoP